MATTSISLTDRINSWRLPFIGIGVVLTVLLLVLALGPSGEVIQASSITRTASLTSGNGGDQYGYGGRRWGTLTPTTFRHDDVTYQIDFLKWDESDQKIFFGLDKCLKGSDFVSLQIGSATFSSPTTLRNDTYCDSNPSKYQDLEFSTGSANPMTLGTAYTITITLRGSDPAPNPDPGSSGIWTTKLTKGHNSGVYGYDESEGLGSLEDRTFLYGGTNYHISHIKWTNADNRFELELEQCLKPSEFVSIRIGTRTFSEADSTSHRNDAKCANNRGQAQEFRFGTSWNPMRSSTEYTVTLTLAGNTSSTPNPSPSPTPAPLACVTSLGEVSGATTTTSKLASSCRSTNRTNSYARFYSFTLTKMSDVQIDLKGTSAQNPYLYLLEGSGRTGAVIESDNNSGDLNNDAQIELQLLPGDYTIEATTFNPSITGNLGLTMKVTPIAAERVKATTVKFGRNLSSPRGLAWDGSTLYMVDDGTDALYTVATSTGVATRVATRTTRFGLSDGIVQPRGLAWDGSTLYMITLRNLYKLNRTTGVATLVGAFGGDITDASGLAWWLSPTATSTSVAGQPPGRLYMVDTATDALYIVDTATGTATPAEPTAVDSSVSRFSGNIRYPTGLSWVGQDLHMMSRLGKLYKVHERAGTVIDLGPTSISSPTDMAWDGSRLYVLSDATDALYTVSGIRPPELPPLPKYDTRQIGSSVRFGLTDVTLDSPRGLAMVNKDLYMVENNTDFLYTVNRETGVAGKVGSAGLSRSAIQARGIAWDGTNIYMLTPSSLYKINRAYGTASRVGALGSGITDAHGLAWDGEKLYMVDRNTDAIYTVSTSTGAASRVNSVTAGSNTTITTPSALVWVGPPVSEVEDDNEMPSLYLANSYGHLYRLDKKTGRASYKGRLATGDVTGLAWADETSTLYFVDDTSDALHTVTNFPGFLPNAGDLYYNGGNFADALVRWDNPRWVQSHACSADPLRCSTYEHDLKLEWKNIGGWFTTIRLPNIGRVTRIWQKNYSPFCTAWSDLPKGYDDCPTAGVLAEGDLVELSFGTFKAPLIERGRGYYGFWIFKNQRGVNSTTSVKLDGQEGKYDMGHDANIHCRTIVAEERWCVGGRQEASILEPGTTWSYGWPSYTAYSRP